MSLYPRQETRLQQRSFQKATVARRSQAPGTEATPLKSYKETPHAAPAADSRGSRVFSALCTRKPPRPAARASPPPSGRCTHTHTHLSKNRTLGPAGPGSEGAGALSAAFSLLTRLPRNAGARPPSQSHESRRDPHTPRSCCAPGCGGAPAPGPVPGSRGRTWLRASGRRSSVAPELQPRARPQPPQGPPVIPRPRRGPERVLGDRVPRACLEETRERQQAGKGPTSVP